MQSNKETKFDYGDAPRKNSDFVMTCTNVSMIDACLHDIGVVVDNVERRQTRAEHDREIVCRHFCLVRLRRDVMQERAEQIQRAQMFARQQRQQHSKISILPRCARVYVCMCVCVASVD